MAFLMGIDLGTSSVKALIMEEDGRILSICSRGYPIDVPQEGFAEQSPELWWKAVSEAVIEVLQRSGIDSHEILCIGLSGQMHGTVLIDKNHCAIRPAIIHCDQRSNEQVNKIYEMVGINEFHAVTKNPLFSGFQIASLLWLLEKEPQSYESAKIVMTPKDFIRLKLTGNAASEYTDASGTLAFDMGKNCWAGNIIRKLGLDEWKFPKLYHSTDIAGIVTSEAAIDTGLAKGTPVIFGGADQPMQALGNGAVLPGIMTSNIGTGGQVYTPISALPDDTNYRAHTFSNLENSSHYLMSAMLNAGLCLRWLNERILRYPDFATLDREANSVPPLCNGLLFLPYITGERIPFATHRLKGSFFGLTLRHDGASMARAVMEGVTFGLRERFEILNTACNIDKIIASGGGSSSDLWLQIQADVYDREIYRSNMLEQACVGAAMAAGRGIGLYSDLKEACNIVVKLNDKPVLPIKENVKLYNNQYYRFLELAQRNSNDFESLPNRMNREGLYDEDDIKDRYTCQPSTF